MNDSQLLFRSTLERKAKAVRVKCKASFPAIEYLPERSIVVYVNDSKDIQDKDNQNEKVDITLIHSMPIAT